MSNTGNLLDNAIEAANKAVKFDEEAETNIAAYYYEAASSLLEQLILVTDPDKVEPLIVRANQYKSRAEVLQKSKIPEEPKEGDSRLIKVKQCFFLLQQAIEEDEHGERDDAIELYIKAVEYIRQFPDLMEGELKTLTLQALDRAEELKGIKKCLPTKFSPSLSLKTNNHVDEKSTYLSPNLKETQDTNLQVTGNDTYSDEEKNVLLFSSQINKRNYVPFMSIDLSEKFQYSIPFSDKDGPLILAPKQKRDFYKFARPDELCSDPCIVSESAPNYLNIRQTVISDCSFVASLAVSASYEKRFGKKLVTAIIFPQSKDKQPLYNPFGKYMMKLNINGIARKVIIDDSLPIDKFGRLLCSYSSDKKEFWISLLEKAYMKVMGGYDFPGSNSNIDLYALTGWIPERTSIRFNERDFDKDSLFTKLESRLANGDVLVTVATGELSDADAERSGLVPTHAYAVMDVQTINGVRLLKLKNPWSHLRWRGNYSELDTKHWTLELQQRLNYDPNSASQFDNGVFWIDYDSLCSFFDVFYMNWNPNLFKYTHCIHQSWNSGSGPAKDLYTMTSNPQFSLEVQEESSGAVWLLLTRHIVDIEDFRENKEYITLFIYKNGKRVYYPYDPPPYIDGVKINSPHYLCKMIIGPDSARKYTVVISQYEKSTTIFYTLRAYSTCPFVLTKILDPFVYEEQDTGEWRGSSAGGCSNHPLTYTNNPRYKLQIDSTSNRNHILVELKGPKQYNIGMEIIIQEVKDETVTAPFKSRSSGSYRCGYVVLDLGEIPAGTLMIIPSTFLPNQEGPFILIAKSSTKIRLSKLQL